MTSAVRVLRPGEAVVLHDLAGAELTGLAVGLSATGALPDLVAMLVTADGKVRTDDDLVFYNNTSASNGAVRWAGSATGTEWIWATPQALDGDIERIVFGCAGGLLDTSATADLTLMVADTSGQAIASATFPAEGHFRAMILFELYRRQDHWRCRLLAQGYTGGLAALVTDFGVSVADPGGPRANTGHSHITSAPEHTPHAASPPSASQPVYPAAPAPPASGTRPTPVPVPAAFAPPPGIPGGPQPDSTRRGGLFTSRKRSELEAQNAELNRLLITSGAMDNAALAAERARLLADISALTAEAERRRADITALDQQLASLRNRLAQGEEELELHDVGIYRYRHRLEDSIAYKSAITALRDRIRDTAKRGAAVTGNTNWTVNGSLVQGRKMVNEVSKLMLRAYNADTDQQIRTMRAYKLDTALTRLDTTRSTITRLGTTMTIRISDEYHRLRRQELELTADYLQKVEEEKERQRQLREDQREQQRADAEYAREQERLERDRHKYAEALAQLEARGETQKAIEVRSQLTSITAALAGLSQRRSNLRLGHVYVISNIGAFGKRMVKIGMTRRLDPMDRVRELGDASVPFRFDVHALIFSDDAVALETALHHHFADRRVNQVNPRREFFYVTPTEVRDAIAGLDSQYLLEFREDIDAPEWRQSGGPERALLPT